MYNKSRIWFNPKSSIIPAIDRLMKNNATRIDSKLAQDLGKYKEIRYLKRDLKLMEITHVGNGTSIIYIDPHVKVGRDKGKFFFKI